MQIKMNAESFQALVKNVDSQLFELINHLTCSICQELLNKPVTTPCGHSFCNGCIKRVLASKDNSGCPLCKNPVNRYCLETDKVKSTLSDICRDLPAAFEEDVKDLSECGTLTDATDDIIRTSKLAQLSHQDCIREKKIKRNTSIKNKKRTRANKNGEAEGNDTDSFLPILKRSKNVIEYASAKKRRLEDLISISQTEAASSLSPMGSSELDKKLEKIEKIPPEEKVKEWFDAVGDNIFINTPNSSFLMSQGPEKVEKKNNRASMIRIDYGNQEDENLLADPYEFIPSQNKRLQKRKRQKSNSTGKQKKLPDFCTIKNFTKESIKRNTLLTENKNKCVEVETDVGCSPRERDVITASQKFDKLLSETKIEERKTHKLYTPSQSSSTQFLDCSYHSQMELDLGQKQLHRTSETKPEESAAFKGIELFKDITLGERAERFRNGKRRRSLGIGTSGEKKKRLFTEIMKLETEEALDLEKSVQNYLMKFNETKQTQNIVDITSVNEGSLKVDTKVMELLQELWNDDVIYANLPKNRPVKLPEIFRSDKIETVDDLSSGSVRKSAAMKTKDLPRITPTAMPIEHSNVERFTQTTALIGFCTQEELPQERIFKQMVEHMEKELNSSELDFNLESKDEHKSSDYRDTESNGHQEYVARENSNCAASKRSERETVAQAATDGYLNAEEIATKEQDNFVQFNLLGKMRKTRTSFIDFLHLGRLTPTVKRSKSSVVKLVFPLGLSSLARRKPQRNRYGVAVQTTQPQKERNCAQKAAAIQTPQTVTSVTMQTSKVVKTSTMMQTSQQNPSVEIQTTQRRTCNAEMQTTQKMEVSAEVQTTQRLMSSTEVQTSQRFSACGIQTTQVEGSCAQMQTSHFVRGIQTSHYFKNTPEMWDDNAQAEKDNSQNSIQSMPCEKKKQTSVIPPPLSHLNHKKTQKRKNSGEDFSQFSLPAVTKCRTPDKKEANATPEKSAASELIMDFENEFDNTWVKNTQRHEDLVELKNKKNKERSQRVKKLTQISQEEDKQSDDSDINPPKRIRHLRRISSQNLASPVRENIEVVDLETPKNEKQSDDSQDSEELMLRVLKNIDLDLLKAKERKMEVEQPANEEKNDESDSDFFVEQTPPKLNYSTIKSRNLPKPRTLLNENPIEQNSEESDMIADSLPKGLPDSESFLMLSAPQNILLTPKRSQKDFALNRDDAPAKRKTPEKVQSEVLLRRRTPAKAQAPTKGESPLVKPTDFQKPNENDQNQLNASTERKTKKGDTDVKSTTQLKATVEAWKGGEEVSQPKARTQTRKRICVVASSVKNPDMIKKFVSKFKLEYSNRPDKGMTHLIVGLHENDDGEVLPLCTPKLLFAMANKKWIVSELWAETCLKLNIMLPEDTFETLDPVGGTGCMNARLSTDCLLKKCEIYLLGCFQTISKEEFADLVTDCGGSLVSKPEKFSFCSSKIRMIVADRDCLNMDEKQLQELHEKYHTVILSRDVIIMSIQSYKLVNFCPYYLHLTSEEDLIRMGYPPVLVSAK